MTNHSHSLQNDMIIDGTYKVLDFLGEGGMGLVYKVEHTQMKRIFALKILKTSQLSESAWLRFRNEAQAIARLDHRNVVKIYDMNQTENGRPYYTMDFLTGVSLADYLKQNKTLPLPQALHVFRQVCSGLAYAHTRGIVHRDIKPANLMLLTDPKTQQFEVKIVDFGIAKLADDEGHTIQGLTKPGEVFGSPLYMSPEQCEGRRLDARSDMYSMAASMFKALTGNTPFRGRTAIETTMMHQSSVPPLLNSVSTELQFPQKLEKIVDRMLAKSPEQRFQSLAEVENELQNLQLRARKKTRTVEVAVSDADSDEELYDDEYDYDDFTETEFGQTETVTASGELTVKQRKLNKNLTVMVVIAFLTIGSAIAMLFVMAKNLATKKAKAIAPVAAPVKRKEKDNSDDLNHRSNLDEYSEDVLGAVGQKPVDPVVEEEITYKKAADEFLKSEHTPYSTTKRLASGQMQTVFKFPVTFKIGTLKFSPIVNGKVSSVAGGLQNVPVGSFVRLEADEVIGYKPKLLSYFRPDDLTELKIPKAVTRSDELITNISRLRSLISLEMPEIHLQESDLTSLDRLPKLVTLNISHCALDGSILARSALILRIHALTIKGVKNVGPLIESMDQKIQSLALNECELTAIDLDHLVKLPNLTSLYLTGCNITDADLEHLAGMKQLKVLDISECFNLTKNCLTTIKGLTNLQTVKLPEQFNTPEIITDLQTKRKLIVEF